MNLKKQEEYFSDWKEREEIAEAMLPIIGRLYRDHGIVTTVYGRSLVHGSMVDILKAHRFARQILENELSVRDSFPVLQAMVNLDLAPARIDIGKLTVRYQAQGPIRTSPPSFVRSWQRSTPDRRRCSANRAMSFSTVSAASADCWPASWSTRPAAATSCVCAPPWCARAAKTT